MDPLIAEAAEVLGAERPATVEVDDRTIRLVEPVKGDPGLTVLHALGVAQAASPVGAAAHGANAVAAGVWRNPELYVARWVNGRRWIVGYRLTGGSRLSDYVRMEGRVPTRLETGHWYDTAPDTVTELFFDAGLLLDEPPFPVAAAPPRLEPAAAKAPPRVKPRVDPPAGRQRRQVPAAGGTRTAKRPSTRLCPACRMRKAENQFIAGAEYCVDCR